MLRENTRNFDWMRAGHAFISVKIYIPRGEWIFGGRDKKKKSNKRNLSGWVSWRFRVNPLPPWWPKRLDVANGGTGSEHQVNFGRIHSTSLLSVRDYLMPGQVIATCLRCILARRMIGATVVFGSWKKWRFMTVFDTAAFYFAFWNFRFETIGGE